MPEFVSDDFLETAAKEVKDLLHVAHRLAHYEVEPSSAPVASIAVYDAAVDAFTQALHATVKYMREIESSPQNRDPVRDDEIASMWRKAGMAVSVLNSHLGNLCFVKAQGWLDPRFWDNPKFKSYDISIDKMRMALLEFNREHAEASARKGAPPWFPMVGALFALLTFGSLMYFLVGPTLPENRRVIFNVWMAFCVACSVAFIGGDATAKGAIKIPYLENKPIKFTSVGGVAVFIVVLVLMKILN